MHIYKMSLITIAFCALIGCAREITYADIDKIEKSDGMGNEIRWIYDGTKGDYHHFIKLYKNMIGGTAYECIKIPTKELLIEIKTYPNDSSRDNSINGNILYNIGKNK